MVWRATYLPFGEVHSITGSASLDYRFPGQCFMAETGLHYNWHRWYDATTGRYTQPDPLGLEALLSDGPSRFAYALNSPLMNVDPTGESAAGVIGGLIGLDASIPDPSDAAWPKWAGYGAAFCAAVAADYVADQILESRKSDKERGSDVPSWAGGEKPRPGESGKDFADRLLDQKYGKGNYGRGPGSEHNKLKKYR